RVVALLYVMLLVGMAASSAIFGLLLQDFNPLKLIQVIQGAAVVTMVLNLAALWKQEARDPALTAHNTLRPAFRETWREFRGNGRSIRVMVAVGLGAAAFSMQDVLLEPYGAQILKLSVSATTALTALSAMGSLIGFALAARMLGRGSDPYRISSLGVLAGLVAFSAVIFAAPLDSAWLFRVGATLIGFGGGLFAVGMLTAAMSLAQNGLSGIALGAWGAVNATAAGVAIAIGGAIRDIVSGLASQGALGPALADPSAGYMIVYHIEVGLLFATLVAIGPLVRSSIYRTETNQRFGLAEFPG
ncbi:MAG: MFS transporter, partial [Chitinophagales bacterium]|nr:MFS transporter [Hyphomicrobiales bacterium]